MSGLMLETVEGLIAQRALVWTREVLSVLSMLGPHHIRLHHNGGHFFFVLSLLLRLDLGQFPPGSFLFLLQRCLWIQ